MRWTPSPPRDGRRASSFSCIVFGSDPTQARVSETQKRPSSLDPTKDVFKTLQKWRHDSRILLEYPSLPTLVEWPDSRQQPTNTYLGMGGIMTVRSKAASTKRGLTGTPTKCQVSKRQISKRPVSKRLKRQVYKTSGLQNVRFTKCQVYKTSGLQNVRLQKNIHIYIMYLWLVEIRRFCFSHVCRQRDGRVLFSILEGFLPYITIMANNK